MHPADAHRQARMDGGHMRRRGGRELGCQFFDPAVFCDALEERRILKTLIEPPAKTIHEKQHNGIIVLRCERLMDAIRYPGVSAGVVAGFDKGWVEVFHYVIILSLQGILFRARMQSMPYGFSWNLVPFRRLRGHPPSAAGNPA